MHVRHNVSAFFLSFCRVFRIIFSCHIFLYNIAMESVVQVTFVTIAGDSLWHGTLGTEQNMLEVLPDVLSQLDVALVQLVYNEATHNLAYRTTLGDIVKEDTECLFTIVLLPKPAALLAAPSARPTRACAP